MQRDPLEYIDGPNASAYVQASPTSRSDPLGLTDVYYEPTGTAAGDAKAADAAIDANEELTDAEKKKLKGQVGKKKKPSDKKWVMAYTQCYWDTVDTDKADNKFKLKSTFKKANKILPKANGCCTAYWAGRLKTHEDGHEKAVKDKIEAANKAAEEQKDSQNEKEKVNGKTPGEIAKEAQDRAIQKAQDDFCDKDTKAMQSENEK